MAFDKPTRNRLASFVSDAREIIADEFTQQFQSLYGISEKGGITPLDHLGHLDDAGLANAALLRERIDYLVKTHPDDRDGTRTAVARLAREQAFTVLNRLSAIRMAEKRGLIVESVGKGYQSKGFKVFEQVAGSGLGETYHRYCRYLFCLFDELAVDLGILFDRRSPQGLLFPREPALLALLDLLNAPDLDAFWAEDETIGWIYQYYNDPAERKKMRNESSAPRNSRELAVRNQFFTPRYVVEFLTDNTLSRIWYEMTQGQTRLKDQCRYLVRRPTEIFLKPGETAPETPPQDGLSQEELLKQPVHIPHRQIKDPREIRLLDPACGSMHFGLYAFDLFEVIYEEAWDNGFCPDLHAAFPSKDEFLKDVPRLIIEHNIHGIDIDPRAVQIAGISLWLRAQKAWQQQKVPAADRPRVRRSNIVCAEPMPGSPGMLQDFIATLDPPLLGGLVKTVFDKMQLAGEAGSLLKIEEEISTAIDTARKEWLKQQGDLFTRKDGSKEEFFDTAEQQVIDALRAYAEQADADSYQRRIFADDSARGFAFIDLCRKRYDAVVMNPPFGESAGNFDIKIFGKAASDNILCAFVIRTMELIEPQGIVGTVNDATVFTKSSYEPFRKNIWGDFQTLQHCVNLGWGVLDGANVEVGLMVISSGNSFHNFGSLNARLAPEESLVEYSANLQQGFTMGDRNLLLVGTQILKWIPNTAFPLSDDVLVHIGAARLSEVFGSAKQGVAPVDSFRVMRLRAEIPAREIGRNQTWMGVNKGGEYCPFYRDFCDVLNWAGSGKELKEDILRRYPYLNGNVAWVAKNEDFYGKPGLCFGKRTDFLSAQILPPEVIITVEGIGIYPCDSIDPFTLLGVINSRFAAHILNTFCGQHKYSGYVDQIPVPPFTSEQIATLKDLAIEGFEICRRIEIKSALSPLFTPLHFEGTSLKEMASSSRKKLDEDKDALVRILDEIDAVYKNHWKSIDPEVIRVYRPNDDFTTIPSFIEGIFGYPMGRWDIRYATGERQPPELPDPFDPLPVCPPGMLQNTDGLPAEPKDVPADYPLRISWPGILVDDENHPEDIVARVREALEVTWTDRADAIETEACELLGVKILRDYFRRPAGFFADHLKRYSKSRRQAPIYWPLSTAKGSYTLWIYYHRLTDQTLHTALADFVDPKLRSVRAEISALRESATHHIRIEELQDLEKELEDFRAEIERIIKLPWKPDLNDGVLITASPLWKLFRLPKWQKDLKACWEKLEKGDYDWAHLAYTIWPRRVEEVCKADRSIAIAHSLEHLCQIEPPKTKARRKKGAAREE